MRISSILIVCCLGVSPMTVMAQVPKSLAECIEIGVERNLLLDNASIEKGKGENMLSQSRANLLPMLTGVFQFTDYLKKPTNVTTGTLLGSDFPDTPTWQTIQSTQYNAVAGIQLAMPLYNQTVLAGIDIARVVSELKHLSYDKAVNELAMQISKIYYLAQTSLEQSILLDENIERMKELCRITEALYEQGVVMEVDVTRVSINLQTLEMERDRCNTLHNQQLNMLRFLMDMDIRESLDVCRMEQTSLVWEPQGVNLDLPELQQTYVQQELINKQIKAVKAGYIPSLSLTGQLGTIGYQEKMHHFFHGKESSQNWFGNAYLGVTLRVPIFEDNTRKLKIRQYKMELQQAENKHEALVNQLNQNYANATLQMNHQQNMWLTQKVNCQQAEKVYDVTEEKYKEGVASMTDLLQDEMRLRNAQGACVQAYCQYLLAQLELKYLSGTVR